MPQSRNRSNMANKRQLVLVTRPISQALKTIKALSDRDYDGMASPALVIQPLPLPSIDLRNIGAVLITSSNAVPSIDPRIERLPIAAVGAATGQAIRDYGIVPKLEGDGSVRDLLSAIPDIMLPDCPELLHLRGAEVSHDLRPLLCALDIRLIDAIAYRANEARFLASDVLDAISQRMVYAALFYSARSARLWREIFPCALTGCLRSINAVCISEDVAATLNGRDWRNISISVRPNETAMFDCLDDPI